MPATFALDIYGTLVDPLAVKTALVAHVGDEAGLFAETWRSKQLEYSFRRGLMGTYRNFTQVTRAALDFACELHGARIEDDEKVTLMNHYRALNAFPDVAPALAALQQKGAVLHAFSNGVADDISALLEHAGLDDMISSIISADEVQTFKPDPRLYAHFLQRTGATGVRLPLPFSACHFSRSTSGRVSACDSWYYSCQLVDELYQNWYIKVKLRLKSARSKKNGNLYDSISKRGVSPLFVSLYRLRRRRCANRGGILLPLVGGRPRRAHF